MFGKLMSIPDELIPKYELLCTDLGPEDHARVVAGLADGSIHPNAEKRRLARAMVDLYHGAGAGQTAEEAFDRVFKQHDIPEDIPEVSLPADLVREGTDLAAQGVGRRGPRVFQRRGAPRRRARGRPSRRGAADRPRRGGRGRHPGRRRPATGTQAFRPYRVDRLSPSCSEHGFALARPS